MHDNLKNIRNLSPSILSNLGKLIVNRIGETSEACMLTRDIVGFVSPKQTYRFDANITLNRCESLPQNLDQKNVYTQPVHAVLTGIWDSQEFSFNVNANILGGMGMLVLHDDQSVKIPVITATAEDLAFYNARLLSIGDTVVFETKQDLPLTETSIGHDYVNLYLSQAERGGGEYIEHHEEPHLWAPKSSNCGGHILLGKHAQGKFYFTGFRIPFKHAVYLSPHTLHSDAYLVGDYLVVYTVTDAYSTVLFRDEAKQPKRLEFIAMTRENSACDRSASLFA